uniref:DUF295 domain-containing protein n=1 Tax=Rhabditophanes sp. KR3021 TaxID=114890 RepID=A0AC35TW74_9BILA
MQYDVKSYCCQLEFSTKCFHKMANHVIVNSTIISDHLPQTYQRVSENENILVAQYEHTRSVLDMKSNRIKDIVESFDKSQKSVGIYVPAGSSQKINELINDEGYYKFCDYQLSESNDNRYDRTQNECSYIGIAHDSNFPHVKFCSNLNYIAVIVYYYDGDIIRWKLKFQYWNCPIIFEMHRVTYSLAENIVLSCDPQTIDVYTTSKWYLFRYDVKLPEIPKKLYH